jgi:2-polyprenyl-3-methyl-5-hydroxy-6-metoxy-1,4-benzoquinol methylase
MELRVYLGDFLIRLGRFFQTLSLAVMTPDNLITYNHNAYTETESLTNWSSPDTVEIGLFPQEADLLQKTGRSKGSLLLLGIGGGREAIPFAQMGFEVTGVDFVPEMVARAVENADRRGIEISPLVQEISIIELPAAAYDIIWFSTALYSSVPTKKKRTQMLRRMKPALKPGGQVICQFNWDSGYSGSLTAHRLRKIVAALTMGNTGYEWGDYFWADREFMHAFSSEHALQEEFLTAGFRIIDLIIPESGMNGAAILK